MHRYCFIKTYTYVYIITKGKILHWPWLDLVARMIGNMTWRSREFTRSIEVGRSQCCFLLIGTHVSFRKWCNNKTNIAALKGKMMSWEMWMDLNCSFRSQTNPTWILEVEVCLLTFTRPIQTFPPIWNSSNVDTPSGNSQVETAGSDRQICAVLQGSLGYVCLELSKSLWKGTTNFLHEKKIEIIFIYMYIVWREVS